MHHTDKGNDDEKIDGNWSDWSSWTACSRKCAGGVKARERTCNNPEPSKGGKTCEGEAEEEAACNEEPCQPGTFTLPAFYEHFYVMNGNLSDCKSLHYSLTE